MPTITNPGVIQTIVNYYLSNGLDKCNALIETGYSESYAKGQKGMELFKRADVCLELRKQRLELVKKTGYSKEQASVDLDEDRQLARELKQPSVGVSATTAKIRLYGMDQMAGSDATVIIINPPKQISSPKSVESRVLENDSGNVGKALESNNDDS